MNEQLLVSTVGLAIAIGSFTLMICCQLWKSHEAQENNNADILRILKGITMTQAELAAELRALKAQTAKIGTETAATLQKVIELEAVIAAGAPVSDEVLTALAELKTQAQATDDLTPDAA